MVLKFIVFMNNKEDKNYYNSFIIIFLCIRLLDNYSSTIAFLSFHVNFTLQAPYLKYFLLFSMDFSNMRKIVAILVICLQLLSKIPIWIIYIHVIIHFLLIYRAWIYISSFFLMMFKIYLLFLLILKKMHFIKWFIYKHEIFSFNIVYITYYIVVSCNTFEQFKYI